MKIPYRNPWLAGVVIVLVLGGIWWYRSRSATTTIAPITAPVERGTLVESASGSGSVVAKIQADVSASGQGRVEQLLVKDGDLVQADQPLLRIKSLATPEELAKAYASLLSAQENVTNNQQQLQDTQKNEAIAKMSLTSSTLAYDKSKIDAKKTVTDANKSVIDAAGTQDTADTDLKVVSAETGSKSAGLSQQSAKIKAQVDVKIAEKTLLEDQRDYEAAALKTKSSQQSYAAALASLTASRLSYQVLTNQLLTAPVGGIIMNFSLVEGGTTGSASANDTDASNGSNSTGGSGTTLFSIVDLNSLRAQVAVNEVDISRLKIGQPATMTFDALPDKTIVGSVVSIDRLGATTSGVTTYNVEVSFDETDENIRPGMSVNANIITAQKNGVLLVPNAAVQPQGEENIVTLVRDGTNVTVPVILGASNDVQTEIVEGLQEGDLVVTNPGTINSTSAFSGGSFFGSPGRL